MKKYKISENTYDNLVIAIGLVISICFFSLACTRGYVVVMLHDRSTIFINFILLVLFGAISHFSLDLVIILANKVRHYFVLGSNVDVEGTQKGGLK